MAKRSVDTTTKSPEDARPKAINPATAPQHRPAGHPQSQWHLGRSRAGKHPARVASSRWTLPQSRREKDLTRLLPRRGSRQFKRVAQRRSGKSSQQRIGIRHPSGLDNGQLGVESCNFLVRQLQHLKLGFGLVGQAVQIVVFVAYGDRVHS